MFNTVVVLREKKFTDYILPRKFSNDSERCEQVYAGFTSFIKKNCALTKMCCFTLKTK